MNWNISVLVTKGNSEDLLETLIFCKNVIIDKSKTVVFYFWPNFPVINFINYLFLTPLAVLFCNDWNSLLPTERKFVVWKGILFWWRAIKVLEMPLEVFFLGGLGIELLKTFQGDVKCISMRPSSFYACLWNLWWLSHQQKINSENTKVKFKCNPFWACFAFLPEIFLSCPKDVFNIKYINWQL